MKYLPMPKQFIRYVSTHQPSLPPRMEAKYHAFKLERNHLKGHIGRHHARLVCINGLTALLRSCRLQDVLKCAILPDTKYFLLMKSPPLQQGKRTKRFDPYPT